MEAPTELAGQSLRCPNCGAYEIAISDSVMTSPQTQPFFIMPPIFNKKLLGACGILLALFLFVFILSVLFSEPKEASSTVSERRPTNAAAQAQAQAQAQAEVEAEIEAMVQERAQAQKRRAPSVEVKRWKGAQKEKRIAREERQIYFIGETFMVGYTAYQILSVEWKDQIVGSFGTINKPKAKYFVIQLTIKNMDQKPRSIPSFQLIDENKASYDSSSVTLSDDEISSLWDSLNPGVQKKGFIVFDIPTNHQYWIKLSGGWWSLEDAYVQVN